MGYVLKCRGRLGGSIRAGAVRAGVRVGAARRRAAHQVALAHGGRARLAQRQDAVAVHRQRATAAAAASTNTHGP